MPSEAEGRACPVCEARLASGRQRTAKWRAKGKRDVTVTSPGAGDVTPAYKGEAARDVTPPQTPPVGGTTLSVEAGKGVAAILAPFESRGYRHDARFWQKMAEAYPALDLELEMLGLANWLELPDNRKKPCSIPRIRRWLRTTEEERVAGPRPSNGTTNGVYYQPNSLRHNRQPPSDDGWLPLGELLPIAKEDHERTVAANRGLTLEQKRARLNARLNGHVAEGGKP
jgi:hypothetical protein